MYEHPITFFLLIHVVIAVLCYPLIKKHVCEIITKYHLYVDALKGSSMVAVMISMIPLLNIYYAYKRLYTWFKHRRLLHFRMHMLKRSIKVIQDEEAKKHIALHIGETVKALREHTLI